MPNGAPQPDYRLILRPLPSPIPATIRLRHALKQFLRAYDLKCLRIEEVPTEPSPASRKANEPAPTPPKENDP